MNINIFWTSHDSATDLVVDACQIHRLTVTLQCIENCQNTDTGAEMTSANISTITNVLPTK